MACCTSCCTTWRTWIRQFAMTIYFLVLVGAIAAIALDLEQHSAETQVWGWFVGGLFVLFTLPVSLWGILQHLVHYSKPYLQRRVIRIMWMVPIYATDAWLALRFPSAAIYLDTLRECYEAYVIYNFMAYLLAYLWESHPFLERDMSARGPIRPAFPLCWCTPWEGRRFLNICRHGVLQYTLVRLITTIISLLCELAGVYHEGSFKGTGAWAYLTFINSASQAWALYCLILFYRVMKEELKPIRPLHKFLCVKFVIFICFWQSVLIAVLVATKVIDEKAEWVSFDTHKAATSIQDFAVCIEMFFAAVAHYFSFPHHQYIDPERSTNFGAFWHSLKHMCHVEDVTDDMKDHVRAVGKVASRTLIDKIGIGSSLSYGSGEETQLLIHATIDEDSQSMSLSFEYPPDRSQSSSLCPQSSSLCPQSTDLDLAIDNTSPPKKNGRQSPRVERTVSPTCFAGGDSNISSSLEESSHSKMHLSRPAEENSPNSRPDYTERILDI